MTIIDAIMLVLTGVAIGIWLCRRMAWDDEARKLVAKNLKSEKFKKRKIKKAKN